MKLDKTSDLSSVWNVMLQVCLPVLPVNSGRNPFQPLPDLLPALYFTLEGLGLLQAVHA